MSDFSDLFQVLLLTITSAFLYITFAPSAKNQVEAFLGDIIYKINILLKNFCNGWRDKAHNKTVFHQSGGRHIKLLQAGIVSPFLHINFKVILSLVTLSFFIMAVLYVMFSKSFITSSFTTKLGVILVITYAGFRASDLILFLLRKRRIKEFNRQISVILDVLLICIDAGFSFKRGLKIIAEEFKGSHPIIAEEFHRTYLELNTIHDQRKALIALAERVPSVFLKRLVMLITQNNEIGVPIYESISQLAILIRQEAFSSAERLANKLPTILTVSTVLFTLPLIFIAILGPIYPKIQLLFQ